MDLFSELAAKSHESQTNPDGTFRPRDVAMHFVHSVQAHLAYNNPEVDTFLDRLLIAGASKWLTDWRRRSRFGVKTAKGTQTDVGQWAGIITAEGEYQQMPLFAMNAAQLRQHRKKLAASRDTLSVEIRFLSDLIDALEADGSLATAADAVTKLGLVA